MASTYILLVFMPSQFDNFLSTNVMSEGYRLNFPTNTIPLRKSDVFLPVQILQLKMKTIVLELCL